MHKIDDPAPVTSHPADLPAPEPPPDSTITETEQQEWTRDICTHILENKESTNNNDKTSQPCKPTSAKLVFENGNHCQDVETEIKNSIDNIPVICHTEDDTNFDLRCMDNINATSQPINEELFGNLLTGNEMQDEDYLNDPILNMMKNTQSFTPDKWRPNLNTVVEETVYDIHAVDNDVQLNTSLSTSSKRRRSSQRHRDQHVAKISNAIARNGIYRIQIVSAQHDGGANRSVTSSKDILVHYEPIDDYAINGVKDGEPAIVCIGKGYLPWRANTGEIILIRCFYCPNASGTIISPSDVNSQYIQRYSGWTMETNYDSKMGNFRLLARDGINHLDFTSYSENNLWFHYLDQVTNTEYEAIGNKTSAVVRTLSNGAAYELWHNRLGHPGENIMSQIHKHVKGIQPLKKNKFYSCSACMSAKFKKTHIGKTRKYEKEPTIIDPNIQAGQHLHADFGFVRGSDWSKQDSDGKLVTSRDGYRSYCLLIDRATRYIWIILTKRKIPPVDELRNLLKHLGAKVTQPYKTLTTDLGGKLAKGKAFQSMLVEKEVGYTLKNTGAFSSAQNGLAEKPNQDLARMMRCMLYGAGLGSEYWSYALRHAVYLKNRLPHTSLMYVTPFEKLNGYQPDLSKLRVFGARAHFMNKERGKKLDKMDRTGTFMTFKGTDKISYIIDNTTGYERVATHVHYDEAYASTPTAKQPPMATALLQSGYREDREQIEPKCILKVKLLHPDAIAPIRGSNNAAGLDVHSGENVNIAPGEQAKISTKLAMEIPTGYHGQLCIRSGYAAKFRARVEAGTIDSDYRGEIFIIISNNGTDNLKITSGDRVAQLIIIKDPEVSLQVTTDLTATERSTGGFGSTGITKLKTSMKPNQTDKPVIPLPLDNHQQSTTARAAHLVDDHTPTCNIDISHDPFIDTQRITLTTRGHHRTQGLVLEDSVNWENHVTITSCRPGTAATKIKNWRKRLKNSTLLAINDTPVTSRAQVESIFKDIVRNTDVILHIGLNEKLPMNDTQGVPMMYFDQLNTVATHLQQIKNNEGHKVIHPEETKNHQSNIVIKTLDRLRASKANVISKLTEILPKSKIRSNRLTRKKVKQTK